MQQVSKFWDLIPFEPFNRLYLLSHLQSHTSSKRWTTSLFKNNAQYKILHATLQCQKVGKLRVQNAYDKDHQEISNPDLTIAYMITLDNLTGSSGFEIKLQYL